MSVTTSPITVKALLLTSALLAVSACSKPSAEYKADVKDESGGQMIVEQATSTGVPVTLPDTVMTNAP